MWHQVQCGVFVSARTPFFALTTQNGLVVAAAVLGWLFVCGRDARVQELCGCACVCPVCVYRQQAGRVRACVGWVGGGHGTHMWLQLCTCA